MARLLSRLLEAELYFNKLYFNKLYFNKLYIATPLVPFQVLQILEHLGS